MKRFPTNAGGSRPSPARCRGITLLEVLISIGILSVGLIATLSLVPAGRTYLLKAAIDDRAATVIPNAYETIPTLGMFAVEALQWTAVADGPVIEQESRGGQSTANNEASKAEAVPLQLPDTIVENGRLAFVQSASVTINGRFPDVGDTDWYRIPVEAGHTLEISWRAGDETILAALPPDLPADRRRILPVYETPSAQEPIQPVLQGTRSATYSILRDGFVYLHAAPSASLRVDTFPWSYQWTAKLTRNDRALAIDPIMATRLDWVLAKGGQAANRQAPLNVRRRYFADSDRYRIPRLNWTSLASGTLDQSVALADQTCRLQDDLVVDDAVLNGNTGARDEFAPPRPSYETAAGQALRRKTAGRMSWLLTFQPEAPGSVADNWRSGGVFDVSIVAFEDRDVPPLNWPTAAGGEYSFAANWDDRDGLLTIKVPVPVTVFGETVLLDDEELRVMFRAGAWILLAPWSATPPDPLTNRQRINWIKIQTAELAKTINGVEIRILPETEPEPDVLVRNPPGTLGVVPVIAFVYRGVVAVASKKLTLE